jgi:hypothetical protein
MEHRVTVSDTDNPKYPVLVTCSCNYQCHCKSQEEADFRKRNHLGMSGWIEASKGYQVGH